MKVTDFKNGILLFEYPDAKSLGTAFVRVQEFYENPNPKFRGQYFKFIDFKKWYSKHFGKGKFTYFTDYEGYNIPGEVVDKFVDLYFWEALHPTELKLLDKTVKSSRHEGKYYVIGAIKGHSGTINHELSHAFFHLYPGYRKAVKTLLKRHKFTDIKRYLTAKMYSKEVFEDEIAAYLMFDAALLESEEIDTEKYNQTAMDLHKLFKKYVALHMPK